jgi:hypothetical protein
LSQAAAWCCIKKFHAKQEPSALKFPGSKRRFIALNAPRMDDVYITRIKPEMEAGACKLRS